MFLKRTKKGEFTLDRFSVPTGHFYDTNYNDPPELIVTDKRTGKILTGHDDSLTELELQASEYRAHILVSGLTNIPDHLKTKFELTAIRFFHSVHGHRTNYHFHDLHLKGTSITSCITTVDFQNYEEAKKYLKDFPLPDSTVKRQNNTVDLEIRLRLEVWTHIFLNKGYYAALPFKSFRL